MYSHILCRGGRFLKDTLFQRFFLAPPFSQRFFLADPFSQRSFLAEPFSQRFFLADPFSQRFFHLLLGSLGFCFHADLHKLFGLPFCFPNCSHSFLEHILDGLELTILPLGQLLLHFIKCLFQRHELCLLFFQGLLGQVLHCFHFAKCFFIVGHGALHQIPCSLQLFQPLWWHVFQGFGCIFPQRQKLWGLQP